MTTFVILSLLLVGLLSFFHLPVTDIPSIETPSIHVSTTYPGASPDIILHEITIPLEKELLSVKGVQEVSSTSGQGYSSINLSFDMNKDMRQAVIDVEAVLHQAVNLLPEDLERAPQCFLSERDQDAIMNIVVTSKTASVGEMRKFCENLLIPRLERIEGVSQALVFGQGKSVWLRLNPEIMAARHVGFNEVLSAIKDETTHQPLGTIRTEKGDLFFEWKETLLKAKDIENIRIPGKDIFLKELGEVSEKANRADDTSFFTSNTQEQALVVFVQKTSEGNAVTISKKVRSLLAEGIFPSTMTPAVWYDKAVWIDASLSDVTWSLVLSFLLVVLIVYLSLKRLSEAFVTCVSIPLSLFGTLAVMYVVNFSLDLLSLLALTLSCGFVIDDAIVMIENIARNKEEGKSPREASLMGSEQICFTILAITLSLVAVFIPLLFMPGMNGRLFREFSCTLAIAILVSGIVSLTIIPMLSSRFSTKESKDPIRKTFMGKSLYASSLSRVLKMPKTVLACSVLLFGTSFFLFRFLPVDLLPKEDRGFLFIVTQAPQSTLKIQERKSVIETFLQKNPAVETFVSTKLPEFLLFVVRLVPKKDRPAQEEVVNGMKKQFDSLPGNPVWIQAKQLLSLDMSFGNAGRYRFSVSGPTFEETEKATSLLTRTLVQKGVVTSAESDIQNDIPFLSLDIDEQKAHLLGFSKKDIQTFFQQTFSGMQVGSLRQNVSSESIFVELLPEYQKSLTTLSQLYLTSPEGELVPLRAVASWAEKLGPGSLHRLEGLPSMKVHFTLPHAISANVGLDRVKHEAQSLVPDSIQITLSGSARLISSALSDTLLLLGAAVIVMYIILGILYESFIHPLTILSSVPFACLGGILTLLAAKEPLSIFSAVGFLLLIGIVKKNGIMMVDYALERERAGLSPHEAIYEACLTRFRPIMMTTIAAISGAIPIAIGVGESAEMLRGLGLVIVGGLLFSQVLTLYVTPLLYLFFHSSSSPAPLPGEVTHEARCHNEE